MIFLDFSLASAPFPLSLKNFAWFLPPHYPPPPPTSPAPPRRHPWQASLPGHAFLPLRGGIPSSMPSIFSSHSTSPLWSFVYCPPPTSPHTELTTCQCKFLQTIQLLPVLCFSVCRWIFHIHFKYQSRTQCSYPVVPIWLNILLWVPHQGTICFRNRTTVSLGFLSDLNNPVSNHKTLCHNLNLMTTYLLQKGK